MMKEKVTTEISASALQQLQLLIEEPIQNSNTNQTVLELLQGEARIIRYPQSTHRMNYIGAFIQAFGADEYIHLLLEVGEKITIVDVVLEATLAQSDTLDIQLELTKEGQHQFSEEFWQAFIELPTDALQQDAEITLESWAMYIDFLVNKMDYSFTIEAIEEIENGEYIIHLMEEPPVHELKIDESYQVFIKQAFLEKPLARVLNWNETERQVVVVADENIVAYKGYEINLYSNEERQQLIKTKQQIHRLIGQLKKQPILQNPLLNGYSANTSTMGLSGFFAQPEDFLAIIEQVVSKSLDEYTSIAICTTNKQVEETLKQQYMHLLPITSSNEVDEALSHVKSSILEKSMMKRNEVANNLSEEEEAIQLRSIEQEQQKINRYKSQIEQLESIQQHLTDEKNKSDEKINVFSNLIKSYQEEQEQLAFRNDQLINAKVDLENSIEQQKKLLEKIQLQQQDDKKYYEELEKDWLIFNKESAIYTDHIVAQKNRSKAQNIINDCQQKIEKIKTKQKLADQLLEEMTEELQIFKDNQQVEQVGIVSRKMKNVADFLNLPLDLQFAHSYAELTNIYMEKHSEIEALQYRFASDKQVIVEELAKLEITPIKPTTTPYNYDRHYMEEKMNHVLMLIESKPIALGINYKAKQRWKEQLTLAVEDFYSMELAMEQEHKLLEDKLMAQLQYADQLQQHFATDMQNLQTAMHDEQKALEESYQQYIDIIATAKQETTEMEKKIQKGLQSTKGRSEVYDSLTELEKARKGYKAELLSKYEALENQANDIEKVTKYIDILEQKHKEKEQEVLHDKREMNTQIDVLQHDIVNSKTSIENLNKSKNIMDEQQAELLRQVEICQKKIGQSKEVQNQIQENLAFKETNKHSFKAQLTELEKWHEELKSEKVSPEWRAYIGKQSKLRFVHTLQDLENTQSDIVVIEDEKYSWIELAMLLDEQQQIVFVTDDLTERNPVMLDEFNHYLQLKNKSLLQRQQLIQAVQKNPFEKHAQKYEKIEQPYLVVDEKSKLSS
ncbi:MAG: hypothetical protein KBT36_00280 [Kurthia sp.]|nr:hypothetical protein [Candidatus Kurthia equi]